MNPIDEHTEHNERAAHAEHPEHAEHLAKLNQMIKGVRIAMLTTIEADGSLRSRPMATQEARTDGTLWFFTYADAPKVDEVRRERHVNLSYADPADSRYVSISGTARVVHDREKAKELWTPRVKAWFPNGVDDPNLAMLRVSIERAEYWDSPSGKMVKLYGFIKAMVTGKPPAPSERGENQKLDLGTTHA